MNLRRLIFIAVCLAQLAVPLSLAYKHERTRDAGTLWRFQTGPVDPADPFRGRYVRLSFALDREPVPMADSGLIYLAPETRAYAELAAGPDGYARLVRLHQQRPEGVEYLDVFVQNMRYDEESEGKRPSAAYVRLPFDRYYLNEERAPEVETAYFKASREAQARTYVEVRILDGHAALTSLVLDGKPMD